VTNPDIFLAGKTTVKLHLPICYKTQLLHQHITHRHWQHLSSDREEKKLQNHSQYMILILLNQHKPSHEKHFRKRTFVDQSMRKQNITIC
jgi:hypothetical protein